MLDKNLYTYFSVTQSGSGNGIAGIGSVIHSGSGEHVHRKRCRQVGCGLEQVGASVRQKKMRRAVGPAVEECFNGAHVVITSDVSGENTPLIRIPDSMTEELQRQLSRMRSVKIQFGLHAEYRNVFGETKTWVTSNAAVPYSSEFFNNGIQRLSDKLAKFSDQSSGWTIVKILELQLTMIKYEEIMNRTGASYIPTNPELLNK